METNRHMAHQLIRHSRRSAQVRSLCNFPVEERNTLAFGTAALPPFRRRTVALGGAGWGVWAVTAVVSSARCSSGAGANAWCSSRGPCNAVGLLRDGLQTLTSKAPSARPIKKTSACVAAASFIGQWLGANLKRVPGKCVAQCPSVREVRQPASAIFFYSATPDCPIYHVCSRWWHS